MPGTVFRSAVVLGLLAAIGPLAIDIYLPALPAIEADLGSGVAATQMTLMAFFLSFGTAQLVYGPLSDQIGRKLPLYIGIGVFFAGSIACALSNNIELLIISRFLQGIGAAVMMVIPRAIIRDMFTGYEATRLMALVMLVISVSPMLAPLLGTGIIALGGWHAIFVFLAAASLLSAILVSTLLPETLPTTHRQKVNVANLLAGGKVLLRDPSFMGMTLVGGCGMASFFVFIANASFVYTGYFGLSLSQFSLAFAVNAIGFFGTSQLAAPMSQKYGTDRLVAHALLGFLVTEAILFALALSGFASLYVVIAFLFIGNACLGFVIPTSMVQALEKHGDIAGLASSLGGTLQMVTGALMIAAASPFFNGTVLPLVGAIAVCALAAFVLFHCLRGDESTPDAEKPA